MNWIALIGNNVQHMRFVCVKELGLLSRKKSFHFVVLGLKHRSSISRAQPGLTGLDTNHGDLSQNVGLYRSPWQAVKR